MFLSWLVANIGMIFRFIVFIILEICLFTLDMPVEAADYLTMTLVIAMYAFLGGELCGGLLDGSGIITDILNFLIIGGLYTFVGLWLFNTPDTLEVIQLTDAVSVDIAFLFKAFWGIIPCFIFSVLVAIYAAENFDDVVDRRMRYRNSDVAMYEEEIMYTINRFVSALSGSTFLYFTVYFLIAVKF
jgi:hypothetical protein